MIWNPNKECMSRDEMHALQSKRLQKLVTYVYHNVPFYRNKMQEMNVSPQVSLPSWVTLARIWLYGRRL